jgi:quercetin dioxygenase-like cupin family protein
MKLYDPFAIATTATAAASDRPAVAIAHDHADARLVVFRLEPGQQVPVHTNGSSVFLTVISGTGVATGSDGEQAIEPGSVVAFAPAEPHGMRAGASRLVIAALIAPGPGAR